MSALPPGPSAHPAVQTMRWLLRPIAFLEACRRAYGDSFSVRFLGFKTPLVMISSPDALRALYSERSHRLPPGRTLSLRPIVGPRSVLLLEGREHLERRRLMLPPFHGDRMRAYEATVRDATERELARWPAGTPFPVHPSMQALTLDVILRAVFGVTDDARREALSARLRNLLGATSSTGTALTVLLRRERAIEQFERLSAEIDALLLEEIARRRAQPGGGDDICSLLVSARFEDGAAMSDTEVRDQLMTLLLAGHETTATGLAWTFDLLTRHPAVLDRLRAEVDAGEGDAYLRAVIAESLRLRPVIPLAGRRLATELVADGLRLPEGTDVTPAIWLAHTRAESYPEPYAFKPERFLDQAPSTYAWIPYGGGIRRCLGAAFAEMEMRIVLGEVLRRWTLTAASRRPERVARRNVTFSPRRGTRVIARARAAS